MGDIPGYDIVYIMFEKSIHIDTGEGGLIDLPHEVSESLEPGVELAPEQYEASKDHFEALELMATPPSESALEKLQSLIAARGN